MRTHSNPTTRLSSIFSPAAVRHLFVSLLIIMSAVFSGCTKDEFDHLPEQIQTFLNTYYPSQGVTSFIESGGVWTIHLDNSATLTFNASSVWTMVDGEGSTLPTQFLFDQLPDPLYQYIVTTDNLDQVYSVSRKDGTYTVTFHDYIVTYDTATETVSPATPKS